MTSSPSTSNPFPSSPSPSSFASPTGTNPAPPPASPEVPQSPPTSPQQKSLVVPIAVIIFLAIIGTIWFVRSRLVPSPAATTTAPSPSLISESANPFTEANTPEDNPFDQVESDGTVYENPFDVLEDQATQSSTNNTNPFETLR